MEIVRVVFMGSETFSLPILASLTDDVYEVPITVVAVVTQPDKPAGRGRKVRSNPVALFAREHAISLLQPERLRAAESVEQVRAYGADLLVVASYGQIVPRTLLDAPRYGSLNLHPSLLPRFRGASPVAAPILAGDAETGTTLMLMTSRMDAGPILAQETTDIDPHETSGALEERLAELSARLLRTHLVRWLRGELKPTEQIEADASYTERLTKEDGMIDWEQPAQLIARRVRAFQPWPTAYSFWNKRMVRILRAGVIPGHARPGHIAESNSEYLAVGTGEELLAVYELQFAGGRPMRASEAVHGNPLPPSGMLAGSV